MRLVIEHDATIRIWRVMFLKSMSRSLFKSYCTCVTTALMILTVVWSVAYTLVCSSMILRLIFCTVSRCRSTSSICRWISGSCRPLGRPALLSTRASLVTSRRTGGDLCRDSRSQLTHTYTLHKRVVVRAVERNVLKFFLQKNAKSSKKIHAQQSARANVHTPLLSGLDSSCPWIILLTLKLT